MVGMKVGVDERGLGEWQVYVTEGNRRPMVSNHWAPQALSEAEGNVTQSGDLALLTHLSAVWESMTQIMKSSSASFGPHCVSEGAFWVTSAANERDSLSAISQSD